MLYPTHRRLGFQFGLMVSLVLVMNYHNFWILNNFFSLLLSIIIAISGAIYGSEFPDIDSKKSIPATTHPIMRKIFVAFHVTHRGPISHSLLSLTIIWGIPILITYFLSRSDFIFNLGISNSVLSLMMRIILSFAITNEVASLIALVISFIKSDHKTLIDLKNSLFFLMTDDFKFAKESHFRRLNSDDRKKTKNFALLVSLIFFILIMNQDSKKDICEFISYYNVYLIGVLAGCYSHWLGDFSTTMSVPLDFHHKFSVGKFMMNSPILDLFISKESGLRTGTPYEMKYRIATSTINIILVLILIFHLFISLL